jgi:sugar transferase (PEP-CTERM system associated)
MLVIVTILYSVGLYAWRYISSPYQLVSRLLVGFLVSTPILVVGNYLILRGGVRAPVFAYPVGISFGMVLTTRLIFHSLLGQKAFKRRIIVLGAGGLAARIAALETRGDGGFRCAGFIPVDGERIEIPGERQLTQDELLQTVDNKSIDEIIIALEDRRNRLPLERLVDCRLKGVMVSDYQSFCERELGRINLGSLTPSWFFFHGGFRNSALQNALKRAFDITAALSLAVFFFPFMALAALALMLTRDGPILYRQERVGQKGEIFTLIKFRSMCEDAEETGEPQWASVNDDRVTRVGALIRKTRLDELPQLFNVLKGDMSITGPRPERPQFVEQLKAQLPYYDERHRVKPGITGWAQVNSKYAGSLEDSKVKLEHDLYYIKYYSLILDLIIILQTIRVVLWSEGAR